MVFKGEARNYRRIFRGEDLVYFTVKVKQTDLCIGATSNISTKAMTSIRKYRRQVEDYIRRQPVFLHGLEPVVPLPDAPCIIEHMCRASKECNVGPMACIAGAFNLYVAKDLLPFSKELVIENGGDLYLAGQKERIVAIYAGQSELSGKIALRIPAQTLPVSICTSSGTVGHSLSFGKADAVVVLSADSCLADAAATAIGNAVRSVHDVNTALRKAQQIQGIEGALIIIGSELGVWGKIELVKI